MLVALALVFAGLCLWVFVKGFRTLSAPDDSGQSVASGARLWRDRYGLPAPLALAWARGARVLWLWVPFVAAALLFGALAVANPENGWLWSVSGGLLATGAIVIPLLAALVGWSGRPRRWLRPGSEAVAPADLG